MCPAPRGFEANHKRLFRIYREERLHVRRRGARKRALGTRARIAGQGMRVMNRYSATEATSASNPSSRA